MSALDDWIDAVRDAPPSPRSTHRWSGPSTKLTSRTLAYCPVSPLPAYLFGSFVCVA